MANQAWYFGSIGNSQFHIKREDDHIFFSKHYPEIRVSWQFNSAGRIDRITGRKSRPHSQQTSECFVTLVSIDKHQNPEKEKAWIESTATLFPLPHELYSMWCVNALPASCKAAQSLVSNRRTIPASAP